jgi:3-methyladenine DNA glycosylase AlkC
MEKNITNSLNMEITADDFLNNFTAEQRASLPEGSTIIGNLDLSIGAKETLPADLATLKLPDNLIIKGNLNISGSLIEDFPTLRELPKNLTVTGYIDGQFSQIKKLPDGLNVLDSTFPTDFSHSALEAIGKDIMVNRGLILSDSQIQSIVGNPYLFNDRRFYSNAIIGIIPTSDHSENNSKKWQEVHPELRDPNTSAETLARLAEVKNKDLYVLRGVAEHPNTPIETLTKLAKNGDGLVRMSVTNNLNTSVKILTELSEDKDTRVRSSVAHNPNTPVEVLTGLVKDESTNVRLNVAWNSNAPAKVLTELAKDKDWMVRLHVVENSNTPVKVLAETLETLTEFTKNENEDVRDRKFVAESIAELVKKSQKNIIMESTKNYVGNSYKKENEKGVFYQIAVKPEEIEKMQGVGKHNEIALAIEPKREAKGEHPTHNVYFGSNDNVHTHENRELQMILSKDKLLKAPLDEFGNIRLFAASRHDDKMGADLSNFSVSLSGEKGEDGKYSRGEFVGRGYDASVKFGETRVVGVAYKYEFGNNGEDGKSYSLHLNTEKVQKLDLNEYGDARLGIIPYNVPVPSQDGTVTDETRYLVAETAETNYNRTNAEASVSVHLANTEKTRDADGNLKRLNTLFDCNVHTVGDNDVYKLIVRDKNPEKIGKDCSDLVVFEDKYTPEMKNMSPDEIKAAKNAIETNYIGKGWTNNPAKIKLSAVDVTEDGLSKAIENNHTVKVIAIVKHSPGLVQANHVEQAQAKVEGLAKWVVNTYNSKQAPPPRISNIKFTSEQLSALQAGKAVKAEGLEIKKGEHAGKKVDRWITWDNKTGKCHFHEAEPKSKQVQAGKQKQETTEPTKKSKSNGIKM